MMTAISLADISQGKFSNKDEDSTINAITEKNVETTIMLAGIKHDFADLAHGIEAEHDSEDGIVSNAILKATICDGSGGDIVPSAPKEQQKPKTICPTRNHVIPTFAACEEQERQVPQKHQQAQRGQKSSQPIANIGENMNEIYIRHPCLSYPPPPILSALPTGGNDSNNVDCSSFSSEDEESIALRDELPPLSSYLEHRDQHKDNKSDCGAIQNEVARKVTPHRPSHDGKLSPSAAQTREGSPSQSPPMYLPPPYYPPQYYPPQHMYHPPPPPLPPHGYYYNVPPFAPLAPPVATAYPPMPTPPPAALHVSSDNRRHHHSFHIPFLSKGDNLSKQKVTKKKKVMKKKKPAQLRTESNSESKPKKDTATASVTTSIYRGVTMRPSGKWVSRRVFYRREHMVRNSLDTLVCFFMFLCLVCVTVC